MGRPLSKRVRKAISRGPGGWAGWLVAWVFDGLVGRMPIAWLPVVSRALGWALYHLIHPRRKVALKNLQTAFGQRFSLRRRRQILKELAVDLALVSAELSSRSYCTPSSLDRYIQMEGERHLKEALSWGRGAILATAHFGNFPLMLLRLSQLGYRVAVILREPRHKATARLFRSKTDAWGVKVFPDKPRWAAARQAIRWLGSNGVLVLHMDINVSPRVGVFIPFFGQEVPTFEGPATLSLRTRAPLLTAFIVRSNDLSHRIIIQPPLAPPFPGDSEKHRRELLQLLHQRLEGAICQHPTQWWWIHRRFKKARPLYGRGS